MCYFRGPGIKYPDASFISLMVTPLLPIRLPACVAQISILQVGQWLFTRDHGSMCQMC